MTSADIGELAKALAAAQGEMTAASKDGTNPHFKSRYATLASVWDAIRGPLSRNGLSVSQVLETPDAGPGVIVRTMLLHSSGQWICSRYVMPIHDKLTPQAVGSAITYARRYALSAIVGIAPDDDDDGNAASVTPARQEAPKPAPKPEPKPQLVYKIADELVDLLREFAWPDSHKTEFANRLLAHYGTTLADCTKSAETGKAAAFAINAQVANWLTAHPDETRADALQTLFASIMEQAQ
jgi:hypothetical protein